MKEKIPLNHFAVLRNYYLHEAHKNPNPSFGHITKIAQSIFNADFSCISIIDKDKVLILSSQGFELKELPKEPGLCLSAVEHDGVYHLQDALKDSTNPSNSFIQSGIRFYAGMPLITADNEKIGTICVFGNKPRDITEMERKLLVNLSRQVMQEIERHRDSMELEKIQNELIISEESNDFQRLIIAENASKRARGLTQQLLTLSKGGEPLKNKISIEQLIQETVEFALHGSNSNYNFICNDLIGSIEVDKGQISQVIQNLVINADQAMPKGGTIFVKAENYTATKLDTPLIESELYIKISIKDHGVGILKDNLERIFDPFYSTKKNGHGLGLATSFSIIRKHEGFLTVESRLKVGSTFNVFLPVSDSEELIHKKSKRKPTDFNGKVLLMDDEPAILDTTGEMLSLIGFDVDTALNGEDAVELYKAALNIGKPYNLVILDLTIPGNMGGEEAVGEILKLDSRANVIVSSGYSNNPVMSNFSKYGFNGVIAKPFTMEELREVISNNLKKLNSKS